MTVCTIPIDQIREHADDPRYSVGDVKELAASIEALGLLEPLTVSDVVTSEEFNPTPYTVLSGHRRLAALRMLDATTVPVNVVFHAHTAVDVDRLQELRVIMAANTARKQLSTLEEARGYQLMRDEIAVKVAIVVPLQAFEPLNLTDAGLVEVPRGHILSPAFYTEEPEEPEDDEGGAS